MPLSEAATAAASQLLRTIDAAKLPADDPIERAAELLRREMPGTLKFHRKMAAQVVADRISAATSVANDDAPKVSWVEMTGDAAPAVLPEHAVVMFQVVGGLIAVGRSEIGTGITVWLPPGGAQGISVLPVSEEAIAVMVRG